MRQKPCSSFTAIYLFPSALPDSTFHRHQMYLSMLYIYSIVIYLVAKILQEFQFIYIQWQKNIVMHADGVQNQRMTVLVNTSRNYQIRPDQKRIVWILKMGRYNYNFSSHILIWLLNSESFNNRFSQYQFRTPHNTLPAVSAWGY